ncbi:MAG: ABC transporter permease [Clostridiales bacterium]|jgi:oligopeptide transport system permease protein|nr:ABC transporter permease [Clostridiales bacterium]
MFGNSTARTKVKQVAESLNAYSTRGYEALSKAEQFTEAEYLPDETEPLSYVSYSYWRSSLRIFWHNKTAMFFLFLIALTLLFTFIQPYIPNQKDPTLIHNDETGIQIINRPPNDEFIFGTNAIGQDLWSRTWSGTRTSLFIGFVVAVVEAVIGVVIGVMWGYARKLDFIFTELYNVFDNIPQTLILILISYVLHPSLETIIFALCLTGWLTTARYIRNQVMIIRDRDYNLASRCLGTPAYLIILRNLLPYLVSIITMRMAMAIPYAISNEVFVTYIGLGLPLSIPSLGNLIVSGIDKMMEPNLRYQLIFPTVVLCIVTISFYIIGNAFADASDPKNHVA